MLSIKCTNGKGANKISIVSCMPDSGSPLNVKPAYLQDFANVLKAENIHPIEVIARSALFSASNEGRKLTGKIVHEEHPTYTKNKKDLSKYGWSEAGV